MKLSFRIFLWFSLVMAAVAAALLVSSPWLTRTRPRLERWQQASETALNGWATEVAAAVAQRGPDVIETLLRNRIHEPRLQVFVLDGDGREIGGSRPRRGP